MRIIVIFIFCISSVNYVENEDCRDYGDRNNLPVRIIEGACQVNIGKYGVQVWQNKDRHFALKKAKMIMRGDL